MMNYPPNGMRSTMPMDDDTMDCDYPDAVAKKRKLMAEGKLCSACGAKIHMSEFLAYSAEGVLVGLEIKKEDQ